LPSGRKAGVVDVPGHEAFVKNMLAGATGFDLALIVVAADDGVMPQTREHVDIINLLGVNRAVFAITKTDLVDEDMIALVEDDIKSLVKGTQLEGAPVVPVSAAKMTGIDELLAILDSAAADLEERNSGGPFRLPIDRVFTLKGAGTVVTGTLWSGSLKPDAAGVIVPENIPARVRSVQVHGKPVAAAAAGNRVAVNLPGIDKASIKRGDMLVPVGSIKPSFMFDADFRMLAGAPAKLKNRARVRVHHGTAEVMARAVLLDSEGLEPGENGFVQFRLEKPIAAARGDRFIVRTYSPMTTIGGGQILLGHARRRKRHDESAIALLTSVRDGDTLSALKQTLDRRIGALADDELRELTDLSPEEFKTAMESLLAKRQAIAFKGDRTYYFSVAALAGLQDRITKAVNDYHAEKPLEKGINKETVKSRFMRRLDARAAGSVLAGMVKEGRIAVDGEAVVNPVRSVSGGSEQIKMTKAFNDAFQKAGLQPPSQFDLQNTFNLSGKEVQTVLAALKKEGTLTQIADGVILHTDIVKSAEKSAREFLAAHGKMTVSEFKDHLGTSRKYAVPLLEYLDRQKVTRREDDYRVLA
jgi:selenocysteine-specific elongation factor